jgi:hypothetical protein
MKKRLYILCISAVALSGNLLTSCITKAPEQVQVQPRIKAGLPVTGKKLMEIKVRFIGFELDEVPHYTFQDGLDKIWEFAEDEEQYFDFRQQLPKEASNAENQGWRSNPNLVGKWFLIRYVKRSQPQAPRGQPAEVLIITRATLLS